MLFAKSRYIASPPCPRLTPNPLETTRSKAEVSAKPRRTPPGSGAARLFLGPSYRARDLGADSWRGGRTQYLDDPLVEQGAVHATGNGRGQLQRTVPVVDLPVSPQADADHLGSEARTARRKKQEQAEEHGVGRYPTHAQGKKPREAVGSGSHPRLELWMSPPRGPPPVPPPPPIRGHAPRSAEL